MTRLRRLIAITAAVLMGAPAVSAAQSAERDTSKFWLVGGSLAAPSVGGDAYYDATLLGLNVTSVRIGTVGFTGSVGVAPRAFTLGAFALASTAGVALPLEIAPNLLLLPTAGVSLIGVAGSGTLDGLSGLHAGAAIATARTGTVGVRLGLTGHRFADLGATVWLFELGLVGGR